MIKEGEESTETPYLEGLEPFGHLISVGNPIKRKALKSYVVYTVSVNKFLFMFYFKGN